MKTESDTPRTDKLICSPHGNYFSASAEDFRNLCRELEGENTQLLAQCGSMLKEQLLRDKAITRLRAEIEKTSQSLSTLQRAYLRIEWQRDKLRDEVERLKGQP